MKRKPILRIILYVVLSIVVVLTCIQLSFAIYFNNKIKSSILGEIAKQTNNEYDVRISKLHTNVFSQSVYISGFFMKPLKIEDSTSQRYFFTADRLNFLDINIFSLLFHKDLTFSRMELISPSGKIYRNSRFLSKIPSAQLPDKDKTAFSLYGLFSKKIHSINIKNIKLLNADIAVFDNYADDNPSIVSKENELRISNLKIDKVTDGSGKLFVADSMRLIINNFSYIPKDSLYALHVKKLVASYSDSTLVLDSFQLAPNFGKGSFAKAAGEQTDRFKISAKKLEFANIDVRLLFERNLFIANKLNIDSLKVSAYRDKNNIRKPKRVKSLQAKIKSLPIYSVIDTIRLNNALVIYEEVAEGSAGPGMISFNDLNATITGFTSDSTLFSKFNLLMIDATCRLMDKGNLSAHYSFPLNTDKTEFDCSGTLADMPAIALNPILEPNANVSIKDGIINSMVFSFHANEFASKGKMKFVYHNLKIEILNKKTKKSGFFEKVKTFIAERIIIKENNPIGNEPVQTTEIYYNPDPTRFIFNYSWKSIFSGIKPAIKK